MRAPLVSVVIPAYNAATYLSQAVDSALQQTFRDVEVLVVDDGSTDDTAARLATYGERIRVLRQANSGVACARNAGSAAARGRYVAFLDADDIWQPQKIQRQLEALAEAPGHRVCYSAFNPVSADLKPLGVSRSARTDSLVEDLLYLGNVVGTPSTVVCERDLLIELGGFDPALSLGADWDLWLRLALRTEFAYVDEPLVRYRIHDANMSRDVALLERDSVSLLEKALADPALPAHLRAARRRVLAHNDRVLAGSYFRAGRVADALRCAARALARHPAQIRYFLSYPRRALGRPRMTRPPHVLYLGYWGAAEPLGQSLVLPAIERLSRAGIRFTLVTFEKPADLAREQMMRTIHDRLKASGARWAPLRYHKRPKLPATAFDVLHGTFRGALSGLRGAVDLVHGRTFVGGPMGLLASRLLRVPFVYHNEGFYPDEQVDGGVWRKGSAMHRIALHVEGALYDRADGLIVLSERARQVVTARPGVARRRVPVVVVPSVVDLDLFPAVPRPSPSSETLRLVYVGSVGVRYLLDAVARFVVVAGELWPRIELRILSPADQQLVAEMLARGGLPPDRWSLARVPHERIPHELAGQDAGLFFLTQGLSELGCSPTKIGEYWASGLPVVTTPNVSDTDAIVREERVGVVVEEHSPGGYRKAAEELRELLRDPGLRERCRRAAERHYALDTACDRQLALYRQVIETARP